MKGQQCPLFCAVKFPPTSESAGYSLEQFQDSPCPLDSPPHSPPLSERTVAQQPQNPRLRWILSLCVQMVRNAADLFIQQSLSLTSPLLLAPLVPRPDGAA